MKRAFAIRFLLGLAALSFAVTNAQGQDARWAQKMFRVSKHDFGTVARGAEVRHRFRVYNLYKQTIHISNVRTTCGCTAASPSKTTLASGETAYIEVTMDTRRFVRRKDSNLIITFDQPVFAEVRIPITVYIRTDVVFTPGSVNFGPVEHGKAAVRQVEIAYAGRGDWKISKLKINNKHLQGKLVETLRSGGRVNYKLVLTLKPTAPAGTIREHVVLVTNDANSPYVPILVQARVESDVTVSVASLGTMTPGQKKTFNVVLRGRKAFVITKIEGKNADDLFKIRLSKRSRKVHVLPISFLPPNKPGVFSDEFTVTIAGRKEPLTFKVSGRILAAQ